MIIKGNIHTDHRGVVRFVNDFKLDGVKRLYSISHPNTKIVRGWQGHKEETKYFYVAKGSFRIDYIKVDNWQQPSRNLKKESKVLTDKESEVLVVLPGHVTCIRALENDSTLMVFSDKTLEESKSDDYRFDSDYWKI